MGLGDPVQVWRGVTEVPGQDQVEHGGPSSAPGMPRWYFPPSPSVRCTCLNKGGGSGW